MRSVFALGLMAFAGFAAAQDQPQDNYPYTIDPDSVAGSDRQAWCDSQRAQCPLICLQQPGVTSQTTVENDCDPDTLVYSCVCENNVSPNITQFSQTLPYYICTEWGTQCVNNCNNDNTCQDACRADHPCGAQQPLKPNNTIASTASTAAPTATGSDGAPTTGLLGATGMPSGDQGGAASAMFDIGASYSMAILFAGVFAGFAILL
ncbi:hypothetical protein BS50DRAFT_631689 [Corynespora cassiicola Philippines]|uniref:DUF7707 domain-containing protein n=1 Tax=Corynespora cassiicola Philippines TaxID=1448308 RepID=A0A2T2NW86_CORCC|nr:hypothetical protein BS50DRAFT_631689 [Corynespora cassiicola Philippines]